MGTRAEHVTIHQIHGSTVLALYCGHCTGALRLALPVPAAEFVEAVELAPTLDRKAIRERALTTYSLEAITPRYARYFRRLADLWGDGWYTTR